MTLYLSKHEPVPIENFWRSGPDFFNGYAAGGDGTDWLPAFKRASISHLTHKTGATLPKQRTYARTILIGESRAVYQLSDKLNLFGLWLEGLHSGAELYFPNSDGIHIHYPSTSAGGGTSQALPAPFTGFGGSAAVKNLIIRGKNVPGTRGVIIQRASSFEDVQVFNFGWHGWHITADVTRDENSQDPGISNANGVEMYNCKAHGCGKFPGTSPRWVTVANPTGQRPWGSGLRIQGGDANILTNISYDGSSCAGWSIDDSGFLGNFHLGPHCDNCEHFIAQWELDISQHPQATLAEQNEFNTYGKLLGEKINFSYRMSGGNSRGTLMNPYVEGATPTPLIDVQSPNFVISGIGGAVTSGTRRLQPSAMTGEWVFGNGVQTMALGDSLSGSFVRFQSPTAGLPLRFRYDSAAKRYRMDYGAANALQTFWITSGESSQGSRSVAAGTLTAGRLVLPDHYVGSAYLPTMHGPEASLPVITDSHPVGSRYIVTDPIDGGASEYRVVLAEGVKTWRPLRLGV